MSSENGCSGLTERSTASQSSFELSIRPSREASSVADHLRSNIGTLSSPSESRTTLQVMIDALRMTGLPGPVPTISTATPRKLLGQGAQFAVYREGVFFSTATGSSPNAVYSWDVAVKQPKINQGLFSKFSLADPDTQKHLHSLWIEILALTHPRIREHPNIVRLLAWASERPEYHSPLMLVMDLAKGDLESLLRSEASAFSTSQKYLISVDIAAGVDRIHKCGFVHGDLKPGNILLFEESGRYVAKIADFGLCIYDNTWEDDKADLGGTPGWQAPEVEANHTLERRNLPKVDSYSYGLLVWSIYIHSGSTPLRVPGAPRQIAAKEDLDRNKNIMDPAHYAIIQDVLWKCLWEQPHPRPITLLELFPDGASHEESLAEARRGDGDSETPDDNEDPTLLELSKYYDPFRKRKEEPWESDPFAKYYADSLHTVTLQAPEQVPRRDIFQLFLHFTTQHRSSHVDVNAVLHVLVEAAKQGSTIARSMVHLAYRHYEETPPAMVQSSILDWLIDATSEGSVVGKSELKARDAIAYENSISRFRKTGGYNWIYFDNFRHCDCYRENKDCSTYDVETNRRIPLWAKLHHIAVYGTVDKLQDHLDHNSSCDIDTPTALPNNETALYLAFARGDWPMAKELLRRGANPAVPCTIYGITCLHWLFGFDGHIQEEVVTECTARGADLNAKAEREVPFHHYPFVLPAGSPLHWAIATASQGAIKALVTCGAELLLRDGSDPYAFDERVRYRNKFGGPNLEAYSLPEIRTMGLSALDLSALQWDPYIFRLLLEGNRTNVDINATDEEGFTILHHLSADGHRRTRLGNLFSSELFRGAPHEARQNVQEIVSIAKHLGANLNQLTTTTTSKTQSYRPKDFTNLTPLMLATKGGKADVVEALLQEGASVDSQNEAGETALLHVRRDSVPRCVELLVEYGADVEHRSIDGKRPLLVVGRWPKAVDILLTRGANVEQVEEGTDCYEREWNVWFRLAARENALSEERDIEVANLLEKHLFSRTDAEMVRRVTEHVTSDGETMLHTFAGEGMHHCATALLKRGVNPNRLFRRKEYRHHNGERVAIVNHATPIDMAEYWLNKEQKDVEHFVTQHSREEFEAFCNKYHTVIRILKEFGGRTGKFAFK